MSTATESATNTAAHDNIPTDVSLPSCPDCHNFVQPYNSYCEACGATLSPRVGSPTAGEVDTEMASSQTQRLTDRSVLATICHQCGGRIDPDGYCQVCGAKALNPRNHFEINPLEWVAGVCDKGVVHADNEDAIALWAAGAQAALALSDGVSTSSDSATASLAAVKASVEVLSAAVADLGSNTEVRSGAATDSDPNAAVLPNLAAAFDPNVAAVADLTPQNLEPADSMEQILKQAAIAANEAVLAHTSPSCDNPPAATLALALLDTGRIYFASIGDSRIYWIAGEDSRCLTTDDSVAAELIAAGMSRTEAEHSPHAHAITRWLGADAPEILPNCGVFDPPGAGWLLLCSDGLWNYASDATVLAEIVSKLAASPEQPLALAQKLTTWANQQGGHDNISVVLAKISD